jgi:hypothetical protein
MLEVEVWIGLEVWEAEVLLMLCLAILDLTYPSHSFIRSRFDFAVILEFIMWYGAYQMSSTHLNLDVPKKIRQRGRVISGKWHPQNKSERHLPMCLQ